MTDYMKLKTDLPILSLKHGDATSFSIACASILAKVTRDRYMKDIDQKYPQYEFAKHKGYPTKRHLELLDEYGPLSDFYWSIKKIQKIIKYFFLSSFINWEDNYDDQRKINRHSYL